MFNKRNSKFCQCFQRDKSAENKHKVAKKKKKKEATISN